MNHNRPDSGIPHDSIGEENALDDRMAYRLRKMRQPGEGYSEAILRLARIERRQ